MTGIPVVYAMSRAIIDAKMIVKGSHWPADDPVVKAHPDLFSTDPRWGLAYSVPPDGFDAPVGPSLAQAARLAAEQGAAAETATANPGEKRAVKSRA